MASLVSGLWLLLLLVSVITNAFIGKADGIDTVDFDSRADPIFPLHGALFLPYDTGGVTENGEHYMATLESVRPILDIALNEAHKKYLRRWVPKHEPWLRIAEIPMGECSDQKRAAWAALEAIQWTNGSGLDVSFGPACDYILASVARILSFHGVAMFSNAGFSEFFQKKGDLPITRVGPLQDHITAMVGKLSTHFDWKKPSLMYEKHFWESELHEAGFCKLLMNGMYLWSAEKKWDLQVNPRMLPSVWDNQNPRQRFKDYLIESVGTNYGGLPSWTRFKSTQQFPEAWLLCLFVGLACGEVTDQRSNTKRCRKANIKAMKQCLLVQSDVFLASGTACGKRWLFSH
uniref:ANF_receptor domain-containing protein n=1 Tax=Panagrellus redivivus TaxID=6233 RepID=A0A7E4W6R9_PANRE